MHSFAQIANLHKIITSPTEHFGSLKISSKKYLQQTTSSVRTQKALSTEENIYSGWSKSNSMIHKCLLDNFFSQDQLSALYVCAPECVVSWCQFFRRAARFIDCVAHFHAFAGCTTHSFTQQVRPSISSHRLIQPAGAVRRFEAVMIFCAVHQTAVRAFCECGAATPLAC